MQNRKYFYEMKRLKKSETEWKKILMPEQFKVLRGKATELPFTGKLLKEKGKGKYICAGCGSELFSYETKYDSGCGWPSFYDYIGKSKIKFKKDNNLFMQRTEILCANCGGHLGHVFDDGPMPTKKRYCVNSLSLDFKKS